METVEQLKAPFPWFGGKSRVAEIVWERFGDCPNYVEPFAGSLAVMLGRPHKPGTETVNDLDCFLANFWRSIANDPDAVAAHADWPVNEADLMARHRWLMGQSDFRARMKADASYYDVKVAGWWVWGLCSWIGSGWCVQRRNGNQPEQIPHLGSAGMGICDLFQSLSNRLRRVRVACGEWDRVLGESVTVKHGITGVFLDPPYSDDEHAVTYSAHGEAVADKVRAWAIENADNRLLRIALCGYEGEHEMPESWACVAWKARGGYGSQSDGKGRDNSERERIWFSPHCLGPREPELFTL